MKSNLETLCRRLDKTNKEVLDIFGNDLYSLFNFYFFHRLKTMKGDENAIAEIQQIRDDLNFVLKTRL